MPQWIKDLAPDVAQTVARFPFAILLSFLSTMVAIALTNDLLPTGSEFWFRLGFGLSFAAVFAVAGVLFGESKAKSGVLYLVLAYAIPLAAIALMQIQSSTWVIAPMLAPISILWLSISPFTRTGKGATRADIQNRFWWLNHRAITTAIIAGIGFALIALGLVAVERAMAILFGIKASKIFYEFLLPFTGLFLTPVYWLSTIPHLHEYSETDISEPDFLSKAIGFLGQFILTPFLFIYALILLAYGVQIALTQALPEGMLAWMVLGFTIVGAANWLVLHPKFMHTRPMVKYFRKFWFWLSIIPALLYVIGVWVRIEAYGLTEQRVGLIAGGLWIGALTLAFISKKLADIRLIPVLALLIITFFSIGPWNFINLPQINQAARLDSAIHNATPITQSFSGPYEWSEQNAAIASGAMRYLQRGADRREKLFQVLARHGIKLEDSDTSRSELFEALNLQSDGPQSEPSRRRALRTVVTQITDISETPLYYAQVSIFGRDWYEFNNLSFKMSEGALLVKGINTSELDIGLTDWLALQSQDIITHPILEFSINGQKYVLLIEKITLLRDSENSNIWMPTVLEAILFSNKLPTDNSPPLNLTSQ